MVLWPINDMFNSLHLVENCYGTQKMSHYNLHSPIGQGLNKIEVVKRWIFKLDIQIVLKFVKLLLGQLNGIHKITNTDVYTLWNFN